MFLLLVLITLCMSLNRYLLCEQCGVSRHPLAPALSSAKISRSESSLYWIERLLAPRSPALARSTHPGLHSFGYRPLRERASHPSGSRPLGRFARIRSRPLALVSPRKPSVPDRVQFTGRRSQMEQRTIRFLVCDPVDRSIPVLAHDRGVPVCYAGTAFGVAVPLTFRRGKAGHPLGWRSTVYILEDLRRRPNQKAWFEASLLSGLTAPSSVNHLIQKPS